MSKKTPLNHLQHDLHLLYAGLLGLSKAQKELIDDLIEQYKEEERQVIEESYYQGAMFSKDFVSSSEQASQYFESVFGASRD